MKARIFKTIVVLAVLSLACSCPTLSWPGVRQLQATPILTPETSRAQPAFGEMVFCSQVDENTGAAVDPSSQFPVGTMTVTVVFDYQNMPAGQDWSLRMFDGDRKLQGNDHEKWSEGESGWVSYELSEDLSANPLAGQYTIQLFIGDQVAQAASFTVTVPEITRSSFPAFGPVTFAQGISDENAPIQPGAVFDYGVEAVYAVFPYVNMEDGQSFSREWLHDGKQDVRTDLTWDEGAEGVTYGRLHTAGGIDPGTYTLNLYIDGQIARSADFEILPPPEPEATPMPTEAPDVPSQPDEIIDASLMPAYQLLADSESEGARYLAEFILKDHVKIYLDPKYNGLAAFSYSCTDKPPKHAGDVGEIKVSNSFFNQTGWIEMAGVLAHETTHAIQRTQGKPCGCTVEKEYDAYSVQGGFWVLSGRGDLVTSYVGDDIFDAAGNFDKNKFWWAIKKIYTNCPDY